MKKQTAVEFLIDWMGKNQYFIGNDLLKAVKEAKEMEKKQIIDFAIKTRYVDDIKQYYNETYKNTEE